MSPRWTGERRNLQSASFGEYGRGHSDIAKVIGLVVNLRFLSSIAPLQDPNSGLLFAIEARLREQR